MRSALTEACTLRLDKFEGPFDLLFHLIEKNQIDLYDIPILTITDQYMDYLQAMQELDLEVASEFLVMAATLLHIKSRMLLPVHVEPESEDMEDPREALILKLVAYRRHKEFAAVLEERGQAWAKVQYKLPELLPEIKREVVYEVSASLLRESFETVLQRARDRVNRTKGKMARILDNERVSLKSKVHEILRGLTGLARGMRLRFFQLFDRKKKSRLEVATAFLAMLEVVKLGRARVAQERMFDDIWLEPVADASLDAEGSLETAISLDAEGSLETAISLDAEGSLDTAISLDEEDPLDADMPEMPMNVATQLK